MDNRRAASFPSARMMGLANAATNANFVARAERMLFEMVDWTAIAGTPDLTIGALYFLSDVPGKITLVPPQSAGMCLVRAGRAMSATLLAIEASEPLQL